MAGTFKNDLSEAADGEDIEAVVIGGGGWGDFGMDERHAPSLARKGEVLTWEEAAPLLDYEYRGAPDCTALYAWTASKVIWVMQYDGSTYFSYAPRNPVATIPTMPGG